MAERAPITIEFTLEEVRSLYEEETERRENCERYALAWFDVDESAWRKLHAAVTTRSPS